MTWNKTLTDALSATEILEEESYYTSVFRFKMKISLVQRHPYSSKLANSLQQDSLEKTYSALRHSGIHVLSSIIKNDNLKSEELLLWSPLLSGSALQIIIKIKKTKQKNPPAVTYSAGLSQFIFILKMSLSTNVWFTSHSKCPNVTKDVLWSSVEKWQIMYKIIFLTC